MTRDRRPACPPPEHLQAARMGVLPEQAQRAIQQHVAGCAVCTVLSDALDDASEANLTADDQERLRRRLEPAIVLARPSTSRPWLAAAIAAAIILLTTLTVVLWERRSTSSKDVPSALALQMPDRRVGANSDLLWRGASTAETAELMRATAPYSDGNYDEAVRRLQAVVTHYPQSAAAHLHLGASQLMVRQPRAALLELERAEQLSATEPELSADAGWYVALALLNMGENDRSLLKLEQVCRSATSRADRACAGARELREKPRR